MYRTLTVSSAGMGGPSVSGLGGQFGHEQFDAGFDLFRGAHERRVAGFVAASDSGGIGHAPVRSRGVTGELGTDLLDLVAEGDDTVEAAACEVVEVLGAIAGD